MNENDSGLLNWMCSHHLNSTSDFVEHSEENLVV